MLTSDQVTALAPDAAFFKAGRIEGGIELLDQFFIGVIRGGLGQPHLKEGETWEALASALSRRDLQLRAQSRGIRTSMK